MMHTVLTATPSRHDANAWPRDNRAHRITATRRGDAERFGTGLVFGLCLSAPMWLAMVALLTR